MNDFDKFDLVTISGFVLLMVSLYSYDWRLALGAFAALLIVIGVFGGNAQRGTEK